MNKRKKFSSFVVKCMKISTENILIDNIKIMKGEFLLQCENF